MGQNQRFAKGWIYVTFGRRLNTKMNRGYNVSHASKPKLRQCGHFRSCVAVVGRKSKTDAEADRCCCWHSVSAPTPADQCHQINAGPLHYGPFSSQNQYKENCWSSASISAATKLTVANINIGKRYVTNVTQMLLSNPI